MLELKLEALILTIEQIPTLPDISTEILALLDDEDTSIGTITQFVERDQALALQILKYANSPFFGTISAVSSVKHAIVVIGLGEVKSLLLAFTIQQFFSTSGKDEKNRKKFWKHSLICSHIANYLARFFQYKSDNTIFISALIHDIGKIVVDQYLHEEFSVVVDHIENNHTTFNEAEKKILGLTHFQIGAKLLKQWNFPPQVISQVYHHHAPWLDKNYSKGSTIIYLANILTKMAGYPCLQAEKELSLAQFTKSKAMRLIKESGFELDEAKMEQLLKNITELLSTNQDFL
ncbi:MAG: HDOD domain-containing protein [Proteobacteria bacterium]|nr:HDOD domain-containing protein [Pseudomonadota bacterium]MBU1640872.1 HDOD domain-containing protein [Pseudomonadota bacterium]